jgi:hypothetical protein
MSQCRIRTLSCTNLTARIYADMCHAAAATAADIADAAPAQFQEIAHEHASRLDKIAAAADEQCKAVQLQHDLFTFNQHYGGHPPECHMPFTNGTIVSVNRNNTYRTNELYQFKDSFTTGLRPPADCFAPIKPSHRRIRAHHARVRQGRFTDSDTTGRRPPADCFAPIKKARTTA